MYKRIVLKLSGEALAGDSGKAHYDDDIIARLCAEIKEIAEKGVEVSLILGGGNYMRGRSANARMDRTKADNMGMLATVMNAIYFSESLRQVGIKAVVMTPFVVGTMTEQFSKDKAEEYLAEGKVIIFAGGSGLPFFSTDMITAIRAAELSADAILFAKNGVDGIYDSDPQTNPNARKYDRLSYADYIKQNLKAIDIAAVDVCRQQNVQSVAFNMDKQGSIVKVCTGNEEELYTVGTVLTNE